MLILIPIILFILGFIGYTKVLPPAMYVLLFSIILLPGLLLLSGSLITTIITYFGLLSVQDAVTAAHRYLGIELKTKG